MKVTVNTKSMSETATRGEKLTEDTKAHRFARSLTAMVLVTLALLATIAASGFSTGLQTISKKESQGNRDQRMLRFGGMSPVQIEEIVNSNAPGDFSGDSSPTEFEEALGGYYDNSAADFVEGDSGGNDFDLNAFLQNLLKFLHFWSG